MLISGGYVNGTALSRIYDRGTLVFSADNYISMPIWEEARRNQIAGVRSPRIICYGDSTTFGNGSQPGTTSDWVQNSYPQQLSNMLNDSDIESSAEGFLGIGNATHNRLTRDHRLTFSGSYGRDNTFPVIGGYSASVPASQTGTMTFTPTEEVDTFLVHFIRGGSTGTLSLSVDGGPATVVNTSTAPNYGPIVVNVTKGMHTLSIASSAGVTYVMAVEAYDTTRVPVRITNGGWPNMETANGIVTTYPWSTLNAVSTIWQPDLFIICLGINDAVNSGVNKATFKTRLSTMVDRAKLTSDVILVTFMPTSTSITPQAKQLEFVDAIKEIGVEKGINVADFFGRVGSYAEGVARGLYADTVHPNAAGYQLMAETVLPFLNRAVNIEENYWVPSDSQELAVWFEANDETISASPVSLWNGMDSGRSLAQSNASDRPLYSSTGLDGNIGGVTINALQRLILNNSILKSGNYHTGLHLFKMTGNNAWKTLNGGNNGCPHFRVNAAEQIEIAPQSGSALATGTTVLNSDQVYFGAFETKANNAGVRLLLNETQEADYTGVTGFSAAITSVGNTPTNNFGLLGTLNAYIHYTDESPAKRQAAAGYLAHKMGYASLLPSGHPFKNSPPTIQTTVNWIADGNSLTAGGTNWPRRVERSAEFLGCRLTNIAVGGQTTQQMSADAVSQITPLISTTRENWVSAMEIRNDIIINGGTARQNVDRFWAYAAIIRGMGIKFFCIAPLDSILTGNTQAGDTPAVFRQKLSDAHALILAEWASHADGFFDPRTITQLQDPTNVTYFTDMTHLTTVENGGQDYFHRGAKEAMLLYI